MLTGRQKALRIIHDVERAVSVYLLSVTAICAGVGVAAVVPVLVNFQVFRSHLESLKGAGEFLGESSNCDLIEKIQACMSARPGRSGV